MQKGERGSVARPPFLKPIQSPGDIARECDHLYVPTAVTAAPSHTALPLVRLVGESGILFVRLGGCHEADNSEGE